VFRFAHDMKDQLVRAELPHALVARLIAHDREKGSRPSSGKAKKGGGDDPEDPDGDAYDDEPLRSSVISYEFSPAGNRFREVRDGREIVSTFGRSNQLLTRGSTSYQV